MSCRRPLRGDGAGDVDRHLLDEVHHRLLGHEAHLEVELGELGLAVAAEVLVAEAAGDLEVAIHPGDHEELLELLGALRQGVDRPRLQARGDDEVAGALRGALDEDRRLDLDEAVGLVDAPDLRYELRAQEEATQHRLAPDVEVAVLEADRLVDGRVRLVDVEGRRLRLGEDRRARAPGARSRPSRGGCSRCPAGGARRSRRRSTTNSMRQRAAAAWASGASAASTTTWVIPWRSRRSRKISWPWSRRRWTQPARRAGRPSSLPRRAPQVWVRYGVARLGAGSVMAAPW